MKNETYKKKLDENGVPLIVDGDFVMELVESIDFPDLEISFAENLNSDKAFGNKLVDTFLIDNRESPISFNPQLSINVLQKFQGVKALAEVGDIKNVILMLNYIEIDGLFTQERKDKYISMCQKHLGI